jgi:predicted MPP superfamily phosphohydrolase
VRLRRTLLLAGLLALWAAGLRGFWYEPDSLRVGEYRIAVKQWPEGAPFRMALLSDLHVGSPFNGPDKLRTIVRRTNEARPQIILLAGDYVIHGVLFGSFVAPEDTAAILRDLRAPLGVFAVLGNHDYTFNAPRIARALSGAGIRVLEDEAVRVGGRDAPDEGGASDAVPSFWLVGVSDILDGPHDLHRALAQVTDEAPVILMTHNPDLFPEIPARVGLTLAGHTHGGQVFLPLLGRPIVPSRFGERYAAGLVVEGGRSLFVTTGLGTSIVPVRFRVPPEIALLTVVPAGN